MTDRRMTTMFATLLPDQSLVGPGLQGIRRGRTDGGIGKVDETPNEIGSGFLVVDTGPWIFGKKVMLPAGVIGRGSTRGPSGSGSTSPRTSPERAGVRRVAIPRRSYATRSARLRRSHTGRAGYLTDAASPDSARTTAGSDPVLDRRDRWPPLLTGSGGS